MRSSNWTCGKCGLGNIGRKSCAECGGQRPSERMSEIIALLEGPDHAYPSAGAVQTVRSVPVQVAEPENDHEPAPMRSLGLRTLDLVLGLVSAATTIVVVVIFSFFVGIVLQAFL